MPQNQLLVGKEGLEIMLETASGSSFECNNDSSALNGRPLFLDTKQLGLAFHCIQSIGWCGSSHSQLSELTSRSNQYGHNCECHLQSIASCLPQLLHHFSDSGSNGPCGKHINVIFFKKRGVGGIKDKQPSTYLIGLWTAN